MKLGAGAKLGEGMCPRPGPKTATGWMLG